VTERKAYNAATSDIRISLTRLELLDLYDLFTEHRPFLDDSDDPHYEQRARLDSIEKELQTAVDWSSPY
jgi:hypothetical protein